MSEAPMILDISPDELMRLITSLGDSYAEEDNVDDVSYWMDVFYTKSSDDHSFWELVDGFLNGEWANMPAIVLQKTSQGWRLANGHHRLTAAILTAAPKIRVAFDYSGMSSAFAEERRVRGVRQGSGILMPPRDDTLASELWSSDNWRQYVKAPWGTPVDE